MKHLSVCFCKGVKIAFLSALLAGLGAVSGKAQFFGDDSVATQRAQVSDSVGRENGNSGRPSFQPFRQQSVSDGQKAVSRGAAGQTAGGEKTSGQSANARRNYLTGGADIPSGNVRKKQVSSGLKIREDTEDGVRRGHISMGEIVRKDDGRLGVEEDSSIFLYYDNFSVRRGMSGTVTCNVRFIVMSTLNRKLNTLSVKLKWPEMETALNFSDVMPNVETYFNYSLLGDGCYSMDKLPNVIVNRCRVAKMSQEECAGKIKWLRKAM